MRFRECFFYSEVWYLGLIMVQMTALASRELSQVSDILRREGLGPFRVAQVTAGTVKHLGRLLHLSKRTNSGYCLTTVRVLHSPQSKQNCKSVEVRVKTKIGMAQKNKSSQACCCKSALTTSSSNCTERLLVCGKYSRRCQNVALSVIKRWSQKYQCCALK